MELSVKEFLDSVAQVTRLTPIDADKTVCQEPVRTQRIPSVNIFYNTLSLEKRVKEGSGLAIARLQVLVWRTSGD